MAAMPPVEVEVKLNVSDEEVTRLAKRLADEARSLLLRDLTAAVIAELRKLNRSRSRVDL